MSNKLITNDELIAFADVILALINVNLDNKGLTLDLIEELCKAIVAIKKKGV